VSSRSEVFQSDNLCPASTIKPSYFVLRAARNDHSICPGSPSSTRTYHNIDSVANASKSDLRLRKVQFRRWTTVLIEDSDARRLMAHYLETDHPILGLFDADLFLDDLSTYSHTFCSDFLVNSVLFWSCVCQSGLHVAHVDRTD
jgi:hypothetical protein